MLIGAGNLFVASESSIASLGGRAILPLCVASFEFTTQDQLAEAKCMVDGKIQVVGAGITESTATVKLGFQYGDFNTLGFAFDELPQVTASTSIPLLKTGVVPTSTPFEIADAAIVTGNLSGVLAYNSTTGALMKKVGAAPAAVNEYQVVAGKVVLHSSAAGNTISYSVDTPYTNVPTIGVGNSAENFGNLSFQGIAYTIDQKKVGIVFPRLSRVSTPQLAVNGQLATLEIEFRASAIPGVSRRPFRLFSIT